MFSTIFKQSKTNCYNHYFEANWNIIKNTWKGIESILNIKNISAEIHKTLTVDGATISNPVEISIFSTTFFLQLLVKQSLVFHFHVKHFSDFLKNTHLIFLFFVSPTDKTEIENVIYLLGFNKSV